jgi:hypothetical protein
MGGERWREVVEATDAVPRICEIREREKEN